MATRSFDLTAIVPVSPAAAIDFLLDLSRHRGLHPFVVTTDIVATGTDATGEWTDWRLVERPRLGPFRYSIRFPARMSRTSPTSMVGTVQAARGCSLITRTSATIENGQTVLRESTTVDAPLPLVTYMTSQARLAHARTYALLPTELRAPV